MEWQFLFLLRLIENNYCRSMWNVFRTDRRNTGSPRAVSFLQNRLCYEGEVQALWLVDMLHVSYNVCCGRKLHAGSQPILCANTLTFLFIYSLPKTNVCDLLFGDTLTESKR